MRLARLAAIGLAAATIFGVLDAQSAPTERLAVTPDSKVWIEGGSTVRAYKCAAKAIDANLATGPEGAVASLAHLVGVASVTVSTAELECGNGTMNEHMRKALKQAEHPTIAFKLESYVVEPTATLTGTLQIAGQERPIQFPATLTDDGSTIRVQGSKAINMKEWGVKPPSLMMGTMKVKEMVTINFDLIVKR
ncbi:MAG: YceI family protein [Gemmatimonadota bacterium]